MRSTLVGRPNVYNILAAAGAAAALGVPLDAIERGLAALPGVPAGSSSCPAPPTT